MNVFLSLLLLLMVMVVVVEGQSKPFRSKVRNEDEHFFYLHSCVDGMRYLNEMNSNKREEEEKKSLPWNLQFVLFFCFIIPSVYQQHVFFDEEKFRLLNAFVFFFYDPLK